MKKIFILSAILVLLGNNLARGAQSDDWSEGIFEDDGDMQNLAQEDATAINGKMLMKGEFLDGDLLKISVLAEDVTTPILGTAFHLQYEGSKVSFLKYEPGDFLEKGGDPFYLVKNDEKSGEVIFGETLRRGDNFPLGGGKVTDFYFQIATDSDQFDFAFSKGVVSTLDSVRQDLDRIDWENFSLKHDDAEGLLEDSLFSNRAKSVVVSQGFEGKLVILGMIFLAMIVAMFLIIYLKKIDKGPKFQRKVQNFSEIKSSR